MNYILNYTNQVYWPLYGLTLYDISFPGAIASINDRTQLGQLTASWEIASVSPDFFMSVGYTVVNEQRLGLISQQQGPFVGVSFNIARQSAAQISPESGWSGSLTFAERQVQDLGRNDFTVEGLLATYWSKWLPARNALMLKVLGRYSDEPTEEFADLAQSNSYPTINSSLVPFYLSRGYPAGTFLGRHMINPIMEYRFPISRFDTGPEMTPLYFSRLYGAVVSDVLFFDGYVLDQSIVNSPVLRRSPLGPAFWSVGAEARIDMDIGYHVPLNFVLGIYWPLNTQYLPNSLPQFASALGLPF